MKIYKDKLSSLVNIHKLQNSHGNWNYSQYMRGLANGMELMLSILEDRVPEFKDDIKIYISEMTPLEKIIYSEDIDK